uniref:uncharacterized protein C4orf19 homolog n=1 Tax=Jaculus jaculus TaxID=51337 RepID=UPI001E1B2A76|nr:uncharacterized protein C4orf19 homolog [Jaculus jaculus]
MGCRCCKMIQSYLFDPVQVPSPGFVNEVNSCKLEEDDTVRLKDKQNSEVLVPKEALANSDGVKRTGSRVRTAGLPQQAPLPQEDAGGGPGAGKHGVAVNGISPTATLQSVRSSRSHQGDRGSWASTVDGAHLAQPFLEGEDHRGQGSVLPASEGTQATGHADCRTSCEAERLALAVADRAPQIPAPDYPQLWDPAMDNAEHEENDCLCRKHPEDEEPRPGIHPTGAEQALNMPFQRKRSWDSLNEAVTTEALRVYFKEEGPAHPGPGVDPRREQDSRGDKDGDRVDEDAAVAEALAALEAATAGEDVDEAD